MAGLGTEGLHPQHVHHELMSKLHKPYIEPSNVTIPFEGVALEQSNQLVLWPHEVFAQLYQHYREHFFSLFGSIGNLEQFWDDMEDTPDMFGHPVRHRTEWKQKSCTN